MRPVFDVAGKPQALRSEFQARAPWWGGHLQTLRDQFCAIGPLAADAVLCVAAADGSDDQLLVAINWALPDRAVQPLSVLLIHGLTGHQDSAQIVLFTAYLTAQGYNVARMNMRGAGPSRETCEGHYHAGFYADLEPLTAAVSSYFGGADAVLALGVSLGGSVLLNYMAKNATGVAAAVTVSTPINLAASAERLIQPRNAFYHRWLLAEMKRGVVAGKARVSQAERQAIKSARTVVQFDDRFIASRFSFEGARDYYAQCSAAGQLAHIQKPSLLIFAENDPWIPARDYHTIDWQKLASVEALITASGGHVGFHGQGHKAPWSIRAAEQFFKRVIGADRP